MKQITWVIAVGGGYGAFLFKGTEEEAEEMRRHKARWEGAPAKKVPANDEEIKAAEDKHLNPIIRHVDNEYWTELSNRWKEYRNENH